MSLRTFKNATVLTLDPRLPRAKGLVVEGSVVRELLTEGGGPSGAEQIDLGGAVVLPGLIDAHFHLREVGSRARELDAAGARGVAEIAARVAARARLTPKGEWLDGFGWNETEWTEPGALHKSALDAAAPGVPVYLGRIDYHAAWVSSAALAAAGIDAHTPDPVGGSIGRDERGEPTGLLVDRAMELVRAVRGKPSRSLLRADLLAGIARCRAAGLTCVHDMMLTPEVLELLCELDASGELGVRVRGYLHGSSAELAPLLADAGAPWAAPPHRRGQPRRVEVRGVKLFTDGALGSRGAALYEPYCDCPTSHGLFIQDPEELAQRAAEVHTTGYQLAIHAIGDRANQVALDAIERAQGPDRTRRHRVEHAQLLREDAVPRFAALGVIPSMQPTHCTSDMHMAEARLGRARLRYAYAWRTLTDSGARLALGSDAPIELENPWFGVHAAVTRQDRSNQPPGGFLPTERLSLEEALAGFTSGAAYAAHDESSLGRIWPGAVADFTVVAAEPANLASTQLHAQKILGVVGGGQSAGR